MEMRHPMLMAIACLWTSGLFAQNTPPAAPTRPVTDVYAGVTLTDPYRYMESADDATTAEWVRKQAAYTRAQLDRIPGLAALRDRVNALDKSLETRLYSMQLTDSGSLFYLKRLPGDQVFKLYSRPASKGKERLVFDPELLHQKTGKTHTINNYSISPDGRAVAMVLSQSDAEYGTLRVLDVATGRDVTEPIRDIWGELPASWRADSRSFFYIKGGAREEGAPTSFGRNRVLERRLGGGEDRVIMGWECARGPEIRKGDWPWIEEAPGSPFLVALRTEGTAGILRIAVLPARELGLPEPAWKDVVQETDRVRGACVDGKHLFVRTFQEASRFRILRYDLSKPGAAPVEVVPSQKGVIEQMSVGADGLYVVVREASASRVFRLPRGKAGVLEPIRLPYSGAASLLATHPLQPGAYLELDAWTRLPRILRARAGQVQDTGLLSQAKGTLGSDWVSEDVMCPSHDGAMVPMTLIHRKGMEKNGRNPLILNGYGGYGIPEPAAFMPTWGAWYEQGGIFAIASPRGSGAYGEDWYRAGVGPTKANTWKDMIACGEWLVSKGYTSRERLAIMGTSMGGVAAGRAATERPDLFAVALWRVGILDAVRFVAASPNGPNHLLEMGDPASESGIRQLIDMSTYEHIQPGVHYPATLITTGVHDNRVPSWIACKTAARLQAASAGGGPILLRVEEEGGHGVSSGASLRNNERADLLAFTLWNMGIPAFQPAPEGMPPSP